MPADNEPTDAPRSPADRLSKQADQQRTELLRLKRKCRLLKGRARRRVDDLANQLEGECLALLLEMYATGASLRDIIYSIQRQTDLGRELSLEHLVLAVVRLLQRYTEREQ